MNKLSFSDLVAVGVLHFSYEFKELSTDVTKSSESELQFVKFNLEVITPA